MSSKRKAGRSVNPTRHQTGVVSTTPIADAEMLGYVRSWISQEYVDITPTDHPEAWLFFCRAVALAEKALSLPPALLLSEGDREKLAMLIDPVAYDPANSADRFIEFDREQARDRADVFLKEGYRKVTALDRETLVEEIAGEICGRAEHPRGGPIPCGLCLDTASALISRAEGTTNG